MNHFLDLAGKPYRPSNGTEGLVFAETFCSRCKWSRDKDCETQLHAITYDIHESEYPKVWIYDAEGRPTCLSFCRASEWNWCYYLILTNRGEHYAPAFVSNDFPGIAITLDRSMWTLTHARSGKTLIADAWHCFDGLRNLIEKHFVGINFDRDMDGHSELSNTERNAIELMYCETEE